MLYNAKTGNGGSSIKSKTPQKNVTPNSSSKPFMKEFTKLQSMGMNKSNQKQPIKYKTKDSYFFLQTLQQIYHQLNFNQFDVFPMDRIQDAKKNIADLCKYLGDQPICRKHRDLLNLYCQNDKQVICVSCVYKGTMEHKTHKIKALETVQKIIDYQTIRCEQKSKSLVHQLAQLKNQIDEINKEMGENYMMISKYTISIIDASIKQLNELKVEMEKKLSLAYRRTTTVINRYNEALEMLINHIDSSIVKTVPMNSLSKHLVLKELTFESDIVESLVNKFIENRQLMQQWRRSNREFEKVVLKKRNAIATKIDSFVVTEF